MGGKLRRTHQPQWQTTLSCSPTITSLASPCSELASPLGSPTLSAASVLARLDLELLCLTQPTLTLCEDSHCRNLWKRDRSLWPDHCCSPDIQGQDGGQGQLNISLNWHSMKML